MYISAKDLKLLKSILEKIEKAKPSDFLDEYIGLYCLILKLSQQREVLNDRAKKAIAERRKLDKNYARKKSKL